MGDTTSPDDGGQSVHNFILDKAQTTSTTSHDAGIASLTSKDADNPNLPEVVRGALRKGDTIATLTGKDADNPDLPEGVRKALAEGQTIYRVPREEWENQQAAQHGQNAPVRDQAVLSREFKELMAETPLGEEQSPDNFKKMLKNLRDQFNADGMIAPGQYFDPRANSGKGELKEIDFSKLPKISFADVPEHHLQTPLAAGGIQQSKTGRDIA